MPDGNGEGAATDPLLDALIAGLYRAAAGAVPWSAALGEIVRRFDCFGVQLFGIRPADGTLAFSHDRGFPPDALLHYLRHYHRDDPRTPRLAPLPIGHWWHCDDHFDDAFVARQPLYRDLILPYGGRYSSGAKLAQDDELVVILGVQRGPATGPLTTSERQAMQRVGRHAQCAVALWRRHLELQRQVAAGAAIVERLTQPVLLVSDDLTIVQRNASARALLNGDRGVIERQGRLACRTTTAQNALLQALQRLRLRGRISPGHADRAQERVVIADRTGAGLLLVLSPLPPEEVMGAFGLKPLVMALLHDLSARRMPDPLLVTTAFALTPAEGSVACAVAAGRSLRLIATENRVSVHTVRAQLAAVFAKVGVKRQAELAAALAGLAST